MNLYFKKDNLYVKYNTINHKVYLRTKNSDGTTSTRKYQIHPNALGSFVEYLSSSEFEQTFVTEWENI